MLKQGRPKKPTKEKKLEGTYREDRATPDEFIAPTLPQKPIAPYELNEFGQAEWDRLSPSLIELGIISEYDIMNFYAYCHEIGKYIEYEIILKTKGRTQVNEKTGLESASPYEAMSQRALYNAIKIGDRYGMNPVSRRSISVKKQKERPTGIMALVKK